jgi:hypothetical protein
VRDKILLQFGEGERIFREFSSEFLGKVREKWHLQVVETLRCRVGNTVARGEELIEERNYLLLGCEGASDGPVDKPVSKQGVRDGGHASSSADEQDSLSSRETAQAIQYAMRRNCGLELNISGVATERHSSRRWAALA